MARKRSKRRLESPEDVVLHKVARNFEFSPTYIGKRAVHCYVSGRWLAFPEASSGHPEDLMIVQVMTLDQNEDPRRICELILPRADLERALRLVKRSD